MKNRFKEELWTLGNEAVSGTAPIGVICANISPNLGEIWGAAYARRFADTAGCNRATTRRSTSRAWHRRSSRGSSATETSSSSHSARRECPPRSTGSQAREHIADMMRCRVSEMPHKIPHYAALLARLSTNAIAPPASLASRLGGAPKITPAAGRSPPRVGAPSETETKEGGDAEGTAEAAAEVEEESKPAAPEPEKVNVGHAIVQDLAKAFQAFLDERKWKSVRYLVSREFPESVPLSLL